jgi:hypothetical protein
MTLVAAVPVESMLYQVERFVHRALHAERIESEWFYVPMNQSVLERLVVQAYDRAVLRHEIELQHLFAPPQRPWNWERHIGPTELTVR